MTVRRGTPIRSVLPLALAALLIGIALAAVPAAPAAAAPRMEVALQDDAVLLEHRYYDPMRAMRQARDLGVTRIRSNLIWANVLGAQAASRRRPQRLAYDFSRYDRLIGAAAAHGIAVQLTITGPAPRWATANRRIGVYRPSAGRFAGFARDVALHFRGRVSRYSIWNEPNYVGWLAPLGNAPRLYRALYAGGYRAIKRIDPGAQVLIGETAPYSSKRAMAPLKFLRGVTCRGPDWRRRGGCRGLLADGFAHHPYEFTRSPDSSYPGADNVTIGTLGRLNDALSRLASAGALRSPRGGAPSIYLTEFGYFGTGKRALSPARRAAYLRRAFQIARATPRVKQMLQYLLISPPRSLGNFDTALLPRSGRLTRPYRALRAWAR